MGKAKRAYPRKEHLKGASLGHAQGLLLNNRLGWIGMPGTNTPECSLICKLQRENSVGNVDPSSQLGQTTSEVAYTLAYNNKL